MRNEVNQIKIGRDYIKILCEVHEGGFCRLTEENKQTVKVWGKDAIWGYGLRSQRESKRSPPGNSSHCQLPAF